jgi:hypothetical protein
VRTTAAFLCDAASVREGLLHVLGGGITHIRAETFPAHITVTAAAMFELELEELRSAHTTAFSVVRRDDDHLIWEGTYRWQVEPIEPLAYDRYSVPVVCPLLRAQFDKQGIYLVRILYDDEPVSELTLTLAAVEPPATDAANPRDT